MFAINGAANLIDMLSRIIFITLKVISPEPLFFRKFNPKMNLLSYKDVFI
jgi:hypothetical protein